MKIVKKVFYFTLLFLFIVMVSCLNYQKVLANGQEDTVDNDVEQLTINIYNPQLALFDKIELEIYSSLPTYENGKIIQFNHELYGIYQIGEEGVTFDKIDENFLIRVKLDTLPDGYGVVQKTFFITENCKEYTIELYQIDEVKINAKSTSEFQVQFENEQDKIIFANFDVAIEEIKNQTAEYQYCATIINGGKTYYRKFNLADDAIENTDKTILEDVMLNEAPSEANFSNNPQIVQNEGSRFVIHYDSTTMEQEIVQKVANAMEDIDNFFCSTTGYNFAKPSSYENGEYHIYLLHKGTLPLYDSEGATAELSSSTTNAYSITYLRYEKLIEEDYFKSVLAHEYFHAIINEVSPNHVNTNDYKWVHEAFAAFASLLYMSERNICNIAVRNSYLFFLSDFYKYSHRQINNFENGNKIYGNFLLPLYIYQNYGMQAIKDIIVEYGVTENVFPVFDQVLNKYGTNFSQLLLAFFKDSIFPEVYYDSINSYYRMEWHLSRAAHLITIGEEDADDEYCERRSTIEYYSGGFIAVDSVDCSNYDVYCTINRNNNIDIKLFTGKKDKDGNIQILRNETNFNLVTIPVYNFGNDECKQIIYACINNVENSRTTAVDFDITLVHQTEELELGKAKDVTKHLHGWRDFVYYKFTPEVTDVYECKVDAITTAGIISKRPEVITICDENKMTIRRYDKDIEGSYAINVEDKTNNVAAKLNAGQVYYIKIKYYHSEYNQFNLIIDQIKEKIDFSNQDCYEQKNIPLKTGDTVFMIEPSKYGVFNISFKYNGTNTKNITYRILFEYMGNYNNNIVKSINNVDNTAISRVGFRLNAKIYICVVNVPQETTFDISIQRSIESAVTLQTDPNSNVVVGSEVNLNNGVYAGTTITAGYTRCIYLSGTYKTESRLNYYWYSLDESKAMITPYGTIIAREVKEETTVIIMAVCKTDLEKVGQIEFTIYPDNSNQTKNVILTTDQRQGDMPAGTEVTENNGVVGQNTIHTGYTRYICFQSGNPTDSIQDFEWSSSNSEIATVSSFGTITAGEKTGTVTIVGVYKYNTNFVATLTVIVI